MDITENKLQQIIIEELKEVLGMDQEYTGSEMDVNAENDLAGALMSLQKAGYSRQEVLDMVDDAYGVTSDPERVQEDFFSDSDKEEEAEAKQRAAQGETTGGNEEDDPGQYVTTSEGCPEHTSGAKIRVKVR
jgi:hypothetical protein